VEQRIDLTEQEKTRFGSEYVLFPNPTDGHWIRAIFGESEPAPSDSNRETLKSAATRRTWADN